MLHERLLGEVQSQVTGVGNQRNAERVCHFLRDLVIQSIVSGDASDAT